MKEARPDLAKNTLGVLSIVVMIVASLWTLRPFLGATIWAAMLVVATRPALLWIEARLWKRRSLAVMAMLVLLLLLFVLPLTMAISTIATQAMWSSPGSSRSSAAACRNCRTGSGACPSSDRR